jgi:homeobox-leucine zipper protein
VRLCPDGLLQHNNDEVVEALGRSCALSLVTAGHNTMVKLERPDLLMGGDLKGSVCLGCWRGQRLHGMAQLGEPLRVPAVVDGVTTEVLNEEEYARSFPRGVGPKSSELRTETVVLIMNHFSLVEMLMDTVTS